MHKTLRRLFPPECPSIYRRCSFNAHPRASTDKPASHFSLAAAADAGHTCSSFAWPRERASERALIDGGFAGVWRARPSVFISRVINKFKAEAAAAAAGHSKGN